MRRYLPFVIVGAVALLTLSGATILYRAKRPPVLLKGASELNDGGELRHAIGPSDAPVTLEEFGDFQCPPCAALSDQINELKRDYHSSLRVIFRHFPLPAHEHAIEAALAAEAAGMQGRFWEMHDLLFREQSVWSISPDAAGLFNAYAGMLGLNIDRFKRDMQSEEAREQVAFDQRQGEAAGVQNTPTIFLNSRALAPGNTNSAGLRAAVVAALKKD